MSPALIRHLERLAEQRPDVAVSVAHFWHRVLLEHEVPIDGIGYAYCKPYGRSTTLVAFRTSEAIPADDKRLLRDLSAFDPDWLFEWLTVLAMSKPWNGGGVKRHHWPDWEFLFLDGWHAQPVELIFPATWNLLDMLIPQRLRDVCNDVVKVKPDGWFVEVNNVLPKLAELVRHGSAKRSATAADSIGSSKPRAGGRGNSKAPMIMAALTKHHQFDPRTRSALNCDPISVQDLARLAGASTSTVSAFLKRHFGDDGHCGYSSACRSNRILEHLVKWNCPPARRERTGHNLDVRRSK